MPSASISCPYMAAGVFRWCKLGASRLTNHVCCYKLQAGRASSSECRCFGFVEKWRLQRSAVRRPAAGLSAAAASAASSAAPSDSATAAASVVPAAPIAAGADERQVAVAGLVRRIDPRPQDAHASGQRTGKFRLAFYDHFTVMADII